MNLIFQVNKQAHIRFSSIDMIMPLIRNEGKMILGIMKIYWASGD